MKLKALFEGFQQCLGPRSWILSTWVSYYSSMSGNMKENFPLGLASSHDLSTQLIQLTSKFFSLYLTLLASHPYHQHLILPQGPLIVHCPCFHACVSHFKLHAVITDTADDRQRIENHLETTRKLPMRFYVDWVHHWAHPWGICLIRLIEVGRSAKNIACNISWTGWVLDGIKSELNSIHSSPPASWLWVCCQQLHL